MTHKMLPRLRNTREKDAHQHQQWRPGSAHQPEHLAEAESGSPIPVAIKFPIAAGSGH